MMRLSLHCRNRKDTLIIAYFRLNLKMWIMILKSASNLNGNLNCSKELEHYAS